MAASRRRRLRPATCAALLLALFVLLPTAAAAPHAPAEDSTHELTITSITPVAGESETSSVRGRLTNTGSVALTEPTIELVPGRSSTRRTEIAAWAEGQDPVAGEPLDRSDLADVPAGGSASFTLDVGTEDLSPGASAGAAWVSVQTDEVAVHTFLGVHRAKEYEPLAVVWGIPVLLPGERRLFAAPGAERTRAWREAVGEGSRLERLTATGPQEDEAWLLDPTLLALPPAPGPGTDEGVSTAMNGERRLRIQRVRALRSRLVGEQTLLLPQADADIAAGADSPAARALVAPQVQAGVTLAERIGARSDVLWPADGLVTGTRVDALAALTPERPTVLAPSSSLTPAGFTATGSARTVGETPLLVSDETISGLVGDLTSPWDLTLARQRFIAETAAVLAERPGTPRTLLVVPDRASTPSPEAYARLRSAAAEIPWLAKGDLDGLLEGAASAEPTQVPRSRGQIARSATAEPVPPPALSEERARRIATDRASVTTFASVRSDEEQWRKTIDPALGQLTSARWRSTPFAYVQLHRLLSQEATLDRTELEVPSGDVNFFADTGRLQITIINKTDVELANLSVRVNPGSPSLRIEDRPGPLTIGPGGRQSVTVTASALSAGQVPVHVMVTTPDGQELTDQATLHVRVRPTGAATYWIIGGLAALLLGAGTWRTVRRPKNQAGSKDSA